MGLNVASNGYVKNTTLIIYVPIALSEFSNINVPSVPFVAMYPMLADV